MEEMSFWMLWHVPVTHALGKLRQGNHQIETNLGYIAILSHKKRKRNA